MGHKHIGNTTYCFQCMNMLTSSSTTSTVHTSWGSSVELRPTARRSAEHYASISTELQPDLRGLHLRFSVEFVAASCGCCGTVTINLTAPPPQDALATEFAVRPRRRRTPMHCTGDMVDTARSARIHRHTEVTAEVARCLARR